MCSSLFIYSHFLEAKKLSEISLDRYFKTPCLSHQSNIFPSTTTNDQVRMSISAPSKKEVSFLKTCINGINTISGILSVPYALSSAGWLSLPLLIVIAVCAYFTCNLLRRCLDSDPKISSYSDIAGRAFRRKGWIIASIIICLELYLVATGFLILEGDNMNKLSPNFQLKLELLKIEGRHAFVIISGLIILPSVWLNDLGVLSYISAGGVLSSIVIVICVLSVGFTREVGFHPEEKVISLRGMPLALSSYTFCYGSHAVFPTIYSSMNKKGQFSKVLWLSFFVCATISFLMAVLGYLIYGHNIQPRITLNLPAEKFASKVAIYTTLVGPIAKYILTIMPIASALESLLPLRYRNWKLTRIMINTALLVSTVVLAIAFPSFQSLASLIGAIMIVLVSFVIPCVCYVKIFEVYRSWGTEF
ncbi:hypothetical protein CDL15_Pgr012589 [Punica granatum]|uniref:Amino acid transporter transmembrane domain-containing protein n=1 Tax=Punica granatum TaxID=22663 RepID=A0A218Y079_PUNGR|nr:hypothetical protein CDL15_Pgr012589 [Punica granatum]